MLDGGEHTYMMAAKIEDGTDTLFVNFYRNNAEPIMGGMTADEYYNFRLSCYRGPDKKEFNSELFKEKISENFYRNHSVLLKIRPEEHNKEIRYKFVGTKILEYSFKKDNWNLLDRLELYSNRDDTIDFKFHKMELN